MGLISLLADKHVSNRVSRVSRTLTFAQLDFSDGLTSFDCISEHKGKNYKSLLLIYFAVSQDITAFVSKAGSFACSLHVHRVKCGSGIAGAVV